MLVSGVILKCFLVMGATGEGIRTFTFHLADRETRSEILTVTSKTDNCSSVMCLIEAVTNVRSFRTSKIYSVRCKCQKAGVRMKIWELGKTPRKKNENKLTGGLGEEKIKKIRKIEEQAREMFGHPCTTASECEYPKADCVEGRCTCVIGYSYNFSQNECVSRCYRYGSSFTMYPQSGVLNHNDKRTWFVTKGQKCMEACENERSFVCVHAEHWYDGLMNCNLCSEAWNSIPKEEWQIGSAPHSNFYYRHCQK